MEANIIADVVRETLGRFDLKPAYLDEQRDLQPHVQAVLEESLQQSFPGTALLVTISVGGKSRPSLRLLGTSFWPDVEVSDGNTRLAAIEVKLIRPRQPASKAIAEAIGQSIIYSIRYPRVFTFVVHHGRSDDRFHDEDPGLIKRLLPLNIELILRRVGDGASAGLNQGPV